MANGFDEFLVAWVETQAADLAPLLGGPGALRVSPFQAARKDITPRIDHLRVGGIDGWIIRGLSGPLGNARERRQVNCWGGTAAEANEIAAYLIGNPARGDQRLDGYLGTLANVKIKAMILMDYRDASIEMGPASDAGTYCAQIDFGVCYELHAP